MSNPKIIKVKYQISEMKPEMVKAVEKLRYQSWLDTYINEEYGTTKQFIDERFSQRLSKDGLEKLRQRIIENQNNPGALNLVARNNQGEIVGIVVATKGAEGNEVCAIYTKKEVHGKGVGRDLMQAALDWIGDDKEVELGVVSYNERAQAFYRKFGFEKVGEPVINKFETMPEQKMIKRVKKRR